ncbi:MAG: nucleotidyltransferase family protein [Cyanobacteriota bacterium]|nr:nucleotidyltransferase family protein [Cyanobacteriota bacterium]
MIGIIVLAAGSSSRMGQPKQLLPYKGRNLLHHTLEIAIASGEQPIVVVLGANFQQIQSEIESFPVYPIYNSDWQAGMGVSIQTGIKTILKIDQTLSAVIILLCDQPLISVELIHQMTAAFNQFQQFPQKRIVACQYGETLGVPALFDRSLFPELIRLSGNKGAKKIIQTYINEVTAVHFSSGLIDIDTPQDYQNLLGLADNQE